MRLKKACCRLFGRCISTCVPSIAPITFGSPHIARNRSALRYAAAPVGNTMYKGTIICSAASTNSLSDLNMVLVLRLLDDPAKWSLEEPDSTLKARKTRSAPLIFSQNVFGLLWIWPPTRSTSALNCREVNLVYCVNCRSKTLPLKNRNFGDAYGYVHSTRFPATMLPSSESVCKRLRLRPVTATAVSMLLYSSCHSCRSSQKADTALRI